MMRRGKIGFNNLGNFITKRLIQLARERERGKIWNNNIKIYVIDFSHIKEYIGIPLYVFTFYTIHDTPEKNPIQCNVENN